VMAEQYQGRAKDLSQIAEEQGLMVLIAGMNVVRLLPALIVSDAQIEEACTLLRASVDIMLKPV
jgi:succinylornithine aminotransferase